VVFELSGLVQFFWRDLVALWWTNLI